MILEHVHGLHATGMSLNDRFTMFAAQPSAPARPRTPRRRPSVGGFYNQNMNRNLIEQIARRLEQQAKRQSLRQRLGVGPGALRRFGSESSLPGLRRSNSFGDLSQRGVKSRISWRQSNGNLRPQGHFYKSESTSFHKRRPLLRRKPKETQHRSTSFGNLSGVGQGRGRGARGLRRNRVLRRVRGGGGAMFGRINRVGARPLRGRHYVRGAGAGAGARGARTRGGGAGAGAGAGVPARGRGAGRGRGGARGRGRGRGGITRQAAKPVPTKEELDLQLDQYMAGSKSALDRELDTYMQNAMDLE